MSANGNGLLHHEQLAVHRGERSDAYIVVGIHSTTLGPALGGARLWRYRSLGDAIADALRLSVAMTYKAAAAGLDLGGGKAVILHPGGELEGERRAELMRDLGDLVESLEGDYVTAEDVGTGAEDMAVIADRTKHVAGLPERLGGSGDPSPITARGVEAAIRACCARRFGSQDVRGRAIGVIGLGHVGGHLAERLAAAGAELVVSDIDEGKRELAARLGARWTDPGTAIATECEVLAPCALGGAIDERTLEVLRCEVVCGAANNVLADHAFAERLDERGILYAPDFIANAGGLMHVYGELHGLDPSELAALVDGIGDSLSEILDLAERDSSTPLSAARELAHERLGAARRDPSLVAA
ncbi:MAG: Leu/Phe/Val dehydrogenase [Solirubrobacterales bacterium]